MTRLASSLVIPRPGEFGYSDLTDPVFTNAASHSFLQRARDAQVQDAPDGTGARRQLQLGLPDVKFTRSRVPFSAAMRKARRTG